MAEITIVFTVRTTLADEYGVKMAVKEAVRPYVDVKRYLVLGDNGDLVLDPERGDLHWRVVPA